MRTLFQNRLYRLERNESGHVALVERRTGIRHDMAPDEVKAALAALEAIAATFKGAALRQERNRLLRKTFSFLSQKGA